MPSPPESTAIAGLLLTGGSSRRMGFPKARIRVDGEPLAQRIADTLTQVAAPVLEVGPGHSDLPRAPEPEPGRGPLSAIAAGASALRAVGHAGAALVLATDLVAIDAATLTRLAAWPGSGTVVPLLEGRAQPLCARWSARELDAAAGWLASGERSLAPLLAAPGIVLLDGLAPAPLRDADRPSDLDALGLDWRRP